MNILLQNIQIVDIHSPFHLQNQDVWIKNGSFHEMGSSLTGDAHTQYIDAHDWCISPGIFDVMANPKLGEHNQAETLDSFAASALASGITSVAISPAMQPATFEPAHVQSMVKQCAHLPIACYPLAALTVDRAGQTMTEMIQLAQAGAIACTDDKRAVENTKLLELLLSYSTAAGIPVLLHADTPALTSLALMHEGEVSTTLGLKGFPVVAETLGITQILSMIEYTGVPAHILAVSAQASVALLAEAHQKKLPVTAGVPVHQLLFTDTKLQQFESQFKVKPPFRTEFDRMALLQGLKNNTISIIYSDHFPHDTEHTDCEFSQAGFGVSSLPYLFSGARTATRHLLDLPELITILTHNSRQLFKLPTPVIESGRPAECFWYHPNEQTLIQPEHHPSLSFKSPFLGQTLVGVVKGVSTPKML